MQLCAAQGQAHSVTPSGGSTWGDKTAAGLLSPLHLGTRRTPHPPPRPHSRSWGCRARARCTKRSTVWVVTASCRRQTRQVLQACHACRIPPRSNCLHSRLCWVGGALSNPSDATPAAKHPPVQRQVLLAVLLPKQRAAARRRCRTCRCRGPPRHQPSCLRGECLAAAQPLAKAAKHAAQAHITLHRGEQRQGSTCRGIQHMCRQ